jgi:hypothetical protein
MTCPLLILSAWALLPTWYQDRDETPEARDALRLPVAEAICLATKDRRERAFLAAQAYAETHLARYVLDHRCADGPPGAKCDAGRATGPWQVHRNANECSERAWDATLPTLARFSAGARCALMGWRWGVRRCRSEVGGFSAQAGGIVRCDLAWARRRVALMERIGGRL